MSAEMTRDAAATRGRAARGEAPSLHGFVATLQSRDEIADLILRLEAVAADLHDDSRQDPGVMQLVEHGGLDLSDPAQIQRAIVVLGARAELLEAGRRPALTVVQGDLAGLGAALVASMELARLGCPDDGDLAEAARTSAEDTLSMVRRNSPPRSPEEQRWWAEVQASVRARLVPAYVRIGSKLNAIEDGPVTGLLLRTRLTFALLLALPGLVTFAMPVSTPLVCLALALVGAFVVHPMYVQQIAAPLLDLRETLDAEGPRIVRESHGGAWPADTFEIAGALRDLLPILEGERLAGRRTEAELRAAIAAWADHAATKLDLAGVAPRAFGRVRALLETRLARGFASYASARARWEGGLVARVLDSPGLSAVLVAVLTFPISVLTALISPFPPGIDLPLMVLMFGALGWWLPGLLPGTQPALEALVAALVAHQPELDAVP